MARLEAGSSVTTGSWPNGFPTTRKPRVGQGGHNRKKTPSSFTMTTMEVNMSGAKIKHKSVSLQGCQLGKHLWGNGASGCQMTSRSVPH